MNTMENYAAQKTSAETLANINVLLQEQSKTKKSASYPSSHVFYDMYNSFASTLSTDEKMSLHAFFHSCEKSLGEARAKNINSSQFWLDYTHQFYENFDDNVKTAMSILYFPAIGFHKYVQNNYAEAIAYTEKAIAAIDILKQEDMRFIIASKTEQYVNICRVLFAKKDYDKAFAESGNLLLYVLTGNTSSSTYTFQDEVFVKNLDTPMYKTMVNYVTNELITKLYKLGDEYNEQKKLQQLFSPIWNALASGDSFAMMGYKEFVQSLQYYVEGNYTNFLEQIEEVLSLEYEIPNMLQYLIFDKLQLLENKIAYPEFATLKANIAHYYKQALEFNPTDLVKNTHNSSPLRKLINEAEPSSN